MRDNDKPKIFFRKGWWRVTGMPRNVRGRIDRKYLKIWNDANTFACRLNNNVQMQRTAAFNKALIAVGLEFMVDEPEAPTHLEK